MTDICGLYLSGDAVSILALRQTKKGWTVKSGGVEPCPACEGNDQGPLIKAVCKTAKIAKSDAILILPKQQAILRNVLLPSIDRDELVQMARFEAERHIPFHAERHSVGFHVMRSLGLEGSDVIMGAVDGPIVDGALQGAAGAGLMARGVEVSSIALVNCLLYEKAEWLKEKTVALLNLGLDTLDLVLLTDGRPIFARSITLNLRGVLEACLGQQPPAGDGAASPKPDPGKLAMAARMVDCENLETAAARSGGGFSREAIGVLQEWLERLIQELRRTYDFARREMKCPPINALALTGEGAVLHNLSSYLQSHLNMDVQIVNPVGTLPGAAELKFPFGGLEYTIAFGGVLASEPAANGRFRLDLTPAEFYRQQARRRTMRRLIVTGTILALALGIGGWSYYQYQAFCSQEVSAYEKINKKIKPLVTELTDMKTKLGIISRFTADPNSALVVLNSIAGVQNLSGRIQLTEISYKKGKDVSIEGDGKSNPDINNFIVDLRNTGKFSEVSPQGEYTQTQSAINGKTVYHFRLSCPLSNAEGDKDSDNEEGSRNEK